MISRQLITSSISALKISESGSNALFIMDENRISHLPVESETHCLWGLHPRNESRVGSIVGFS